MAELKNWTNAEHHAHDAVGSTKLKEFMDSPAMYYARYVAKTAPAKASSAAMEIGTAFHELLLEPAVFEKHYAVMPPECDGDARTTKVKQAREEFRKAHPFAIALTIDQMEDLLAMKASVYANREAAKLIETKGDPELSIVWTHPSGIECKARFDRIFENGLVVDVKTASDPTPEIWARDARRFRYDIQSALYLLGRDAVFGRVREPFLHLVVGNEPPYEAIVCEIDPVNLEFAEPRVHRALDRMDRCYETGIWESPYAHRINKVTL
jgi:exodeoxyribonuclease VIII